MQSPRNTYLSLGSNQGNKLENLQRAIDLIAVKIGDVVRVSSVYRTEAWGFKSDSFLNMCIQVSTSLSPENLLYKTSEIERIVGRLPEKSELYEARIIDIDLLMYGSEVVISKELTVPHKNMLQRNFVMIPLVEIAPQVKHPLLHETMVICLENCKDSSEVVAIEAQIKKPVSLVEKYNYIAIEGNIGAGKTTLAKMIAKEYNAKIVLERFADNPFLPKFYEDEERFAFPLEMSFLADRYQQLSDDLAQFDLFKNFIVSDYYIFKSLIFAQITLQKEEYFLYRKMFDIMYKEIAKPDLYIYLYQKPMRLMENIRKRGRSYEKNISVEYLDKIHKGYAGFIKSEQNLNTLTIDVSEKDFLHNTSDYEEIIQLVKGIENIQ